MPTWSSRSTSTNSSTRSRSSAPSGPSSTSRRRAGPGAGLRHRPRVTSPLRILRLEDNVPDAELVQATLESDGFVVDVTRVETQSDFRVALAQGFDVILVDNALPTFDGLSALRLAME